MTSAHPIKFLGLTTAFVNKLGSDKSASLLNLSQKLAFPQSKPGNFLVCPLSVEILLALIQAGARKNTAQQISKALLIPRDPERIAAAFKELGNYLKGNEKYNLASTNKIYIKDGLKISDQFRKIAARSFRADIQNINFQKGEQAASEINQWVVEKTNGRVNEMIGKDLLNEDTRAVLVNIVAFKGKLGKEFNQATTERKRFFVNKSDYVEIYMMESLGYFKFHENLKMHVKLLEVPYQGEDITATLILPKDKENLAILENNVGKLFAIPQYQIQPVHVRIPRCRMKNSINFMGILQGLGVEEVFSDSADLSGITGGESLKIETIMHQTFLEKEIEEGELNKPISAAQNLQHASTAGTLIHPSEFHADHPFVFYLKHRITGIFFIGRFYRAEGAVKTLRPATSNLPEKNVKLQL